MLTDSEWDILLTSAGLFSIWTVYVYVVSNRKWEPVLKLCAGCWEQSSAAGDPVTGARTWRQQLGAMWVFQFCFHAKLCIHSETLNNLF